MQTRRQWLTTLGGGVLGATRLAASVDFWNKKPASAWTEDEIQILLTKSPWARQEVIMLKPGARDAAAPDGVGVNGIGLGVGGRQERQEGRVADGGATHDEGVVVWESAAPIIEARKRPLPPVFKDHYTLSLSGVRWPWDGERLFDQLRQFTTIQPNDQPPIQPGAAFRVPGDVTRVLVGFAKDVLQLTASDKSIRFTCEAGQIIFRAKFDVKEMRYHGQVAL